MAGGTLADTWSDFGEIVEKTRAAFPSSPAHVAIARGWLMRRPPGHDVDHCPACGQPRADAVGRPHRHHLERFVGATSELEGGALALIGPQPPFHPQETMSMWVERTRAIAEATLSDLVFHAADWSVPPARLRAFFAQASRRWICGGCVASIAMAFTPEFARSADRVFADLARALDGSRLLATLEAWRAGSTAPVVGYAKCAFCRHENVAFQMPWFQICSACVAKAEAAPLVTPE